MISSAKSLTDLPGFSERSQKACLWVRTSAGPQIGFGHLKRSVTLAQSLIDCCQPIFLIDSQDCFSQERLANIGFSYFTGDLDRTWSVLPKPVAILIDTRISDGLDRLIAGANDRTIPVASIHDLGLNPVPSDILIHGSISPLFEKSQPNAVFYSGTPYMVLDPEYRSLHQKKKQIQNKIKSVFINLGGGDSKRYFIKVLEGLKRWNNALEVIGAPGFAHWGQEDLESRDWRPLNFRWETGPISKNLFRADIAITAGGLAAYEALCAGTPLMALSYDNYQQRAITALSNAGACISLGSGDDLDPARLPDQLAAFELNIIERNHLSAQGKLLVDGLGAQRVSQVIRDLIVNSVLADFEAIK